MKIEDEIKSKFKDEYHKLIVNIHLTSNRVMEQLQGVFKTHGLTSTQFNVLRILRGQGEKPVSIGLIKERMIERNSDVSRIIDRLVKKQLIDRKENCDDRRQKDVLISQKGLDLLSIIDDMDDQIKDTVGHLSIEEAISLNNLLDKARNTSNKK